VACIYIYVINTACGVSEMTILKGDIVKIRPQWQDKGDDEYTWIARNDEEKGRVDISALELRTGIWPMQTVTVDMVEKVEG
jgi:hypothetical protein